MQMIYLLEGKYLKLLIRYIKHPLYGMLIQNILKLEGNNMICQ